MHLTGKGVEQFAVGFTHALCARNRSLAGLLGRRVATPERAHGALRCRQPTKHSAVESQLPPGTPTMSRITPTRAEEGGETKAKAVWVFAPAANRSIRRITQYCFVFATARSSPIDGGRNCWCVVAERRTRWLHPGSQTCRSTATPAATALADPLRHTHGVWIGGQGIGMSGWVWHAASQRWLAV